MTVTGAAWLLAATAAAFIPASGSRSERQDAKHSAQSFLQKAAEGQQAEIILGRLASERAADRQVKEFGVHMMEDHRKASEEIRQLAAREGVALSSELTGRHKDKQERFAQLSGSEFDYAYIEYLLRHHRKDVKDFERTLKAINDPQILHWAEGTLPLLKEHLRQAELIAGAIGLNPAVR
jgi:putative membrane protein